MSPFLHAVACFATLVALTVPIAARGGAVPAGTASDDPYAEPLVSGESSVHDCRDDAEVRAVWQAIDRTWNARDVEAFTALFTDDALFAFVLTEERVEGRPALHARFSRQFPAMPAELRHLTEIREVRTIAAGVCTVDGNVQILRVPAAGTAETTVFRSFSLSAVMLRTPDGWRIRELHVHQRP